MKRVGMFVLASAALATGASAETARPYFGAIAVNVQTRGVGVAWNFSEQWEAENYALNKCGWGACKVYVTNYNSCSALAVDLNKNVTGFATYRSKEKAMERAVYECKRRGGDCRLGPIYTPIAWTCTGEKSGGSADGFEAPPIAPVPRITAYWQEGNVFRVQGAGFIANAKITINVAGAAAAIASVTTFADAQGRIDSRLSGLCAGRGRLEFTAKNGTRTSAPAYANCQGIEHTPKPKVRP